MLMRQRSVRESYSVRDSWRRRMSCRSQPRSRRGFGDERDFTSERSQRPSPHHQAPFRRALRASSRSRSGCATTRARDLFGAGPDPPRLHAGRHRHAPRVGRALAFIREKACEGITAADVAAVMLGSRRLAEMDFKKATGHAIQQEILHVRFERVELLLRRRA